MMKLLLVVLSMLYGVNTQTAETVSGCNSDIIELFTQKRTITLFNPAPSMQSVLVFVVAVLPYVWSMEAPVGKCMDPLPSYSGLNISEVTDEMLRYVYTPKSVVYKAIDNIAMIIESGEEEGVYSEIIKARSILGAKSTMKLTVKDKGDGVLEKITEDGELSYIASIVDIQGDVALLYVCSEEGDEDTDDTLYVISRHDVDASTVDLPDVVFSDAFQKYGFNSHFWRLPQRHPIKAAKFEHVK